MSKLKYTKHELKRQRDALARYERYLPTLQLKKQYLQAETRRLDQSIAANEDASTHADAALAGWVKLFSETVDFSAYLSVREIRHQVGNIAGVTIPVLDSVEFRRTVPDLFATPAWIDEGLRVLANLVQLRVEWLFLNRQRALLSEELRTTSQRVNLFEKVKIPETQDNIRVIRIFLGELQAADVARAKMAKGRTRHLV